MSTTTRQPASLRLVLPLPPSINRQYANAAKGRVLTAEARTFKRDVKKLIDQALLSNKISTATEKALQKALIGVYLTFYFETPMKRVRPRSCTAFSDRIVSLAGSVRLGQWMSSRST